MERDQNGLQEKLWTLVGRYPTECWLRMVTCTGVMWTSSGGEFALHLNSHQCLLGAGDHPEDPPRRHLPDSAARRPSSVVSRKLIHKPPPTHSPSESTVRRRPWLKRKLGM
ncbi:hypothetical protein AAFF_G00416130 [Aldrovandia affinis]|uniref:Uncharacterized protein n=1 Tax=Aldrovandia affinis TaxID=143900 RepID=A0AAD7SCN8_9TELE|nr:hypothetical protein AAFF_G00416130 [Aldrovandia affinis]